MDSSHDIDSHMHRLGQAADTIITASEKCEDDSRLSTFLNSLTLDSLTNLCIYYDCTTIDLFSLISDDLRTLRKARQDVHSKNFPDDSPDLHRPIEDRSEFQN